jgi:hypothetical protein
MMNPSIESLMTFAERSALDLLVWSWQALVLMACVWAGLKLFHVRTPSLRQHIWLISLLVVLTLPIWPPLAPISTLTQRRPLNGSALSYVAEAPRRIIVVAAEASLPVAQNKALGLAPKKPWLSKILPGVFCLWLAGMCFHLIRSV